MKTIGRRFLFLAVAALLAPLTFAETLDVTASTMAVRQVVTVNAKPEKAWASLVDIAHWWSGDHTFSGSAANLRLEPHAGGCFCETLPNGGSVLHLTVVHVAPPNRIILSGALGPFQSSGATGALSIQIAPKGDGSEITLRYNLGGYFPGGFTAVAAGVDGVLHEQITRLARLIDTGSADAPK